MFKGIDLSSDTATKPTIEMKEAMFTAELGDEQKKEDPTTMLLENMVSDLLDFKSAIFFPSATMANQVAIRHHCSPGDEVLAASNAHIFQAESGGLAVHSHVVSKPIPTESGIFSENDIKKSFHWVKAVNHPISRLLNVENTSNFGGGVVWTKSQLQEVVNCAKISA